MIRTVFGRQKTQPFISVWDTRKISTGSSASNQIKLPLISSSVCNFKIDWGDGTSNVITSPSQAEATHTYAVSGVYTITIIGLLIDWVHNNNGDKLKILEILNWGDLQITYQSDIFSGCANLKLDNVIGVPKLKSNSMIRMFKNCTSLITINNFDKWTTPSGYADTRNLFEGCSNYNDARISITKIYFLNLSYCFNTASKFNQPLPWNFSGNTTSAFQNAHAFNQDVSHWSFNANSDVNNMFLGKSAANYNAQYLADLYIKFAQIFIGTGRTKSKVFNAGAIKYHSSGSSARAALLSDGWSITDGGMI